MSDKPILLTRRGEIDRLVAQPSALSSAFLGWQGLQLEYRCADAGAMPEVYAPWHTIAFVCNTPHDPTLVCRSGGKQWQEQTQAGDTAIIPVGVGYGVQWAAPIASLVLMLEQIALATAIEGSQETTQLELTPQFSQFDPLLYQLGLTLKAIVASDGTGQRLYAESLVNTLMLGTVSL
jgi:AraC family transcriptional regulator